MTMKAIVIVIVTALLSCKTQSADEWPLLPAPLEPSRAETRVDQKNSFGTLNTIVSHLKCFIDERQHRLDDLERKIKHAKAEGLNRGVLGELREFLFNTYEVEAEQRVFRLREADGKCDEQVVKDVNRLLADFKEILKSAKYYFNDAMFVYKTHHLDTDDLVKTNFQIDEFIRKIDATPIPQGLEEITVLCNRAVTSVENRMHDVDVKMFNTEKTANARVKALVTLLVTTAAVMVFLWARCRPTAQSVNTAGQGRAEERPREPPLLPRGGNTTGATGNKDGTNQELEKGRGAEGAAQEEEEGDRDKQGTNKEMEKGRGGEGTVPEEEEGGGAAQCRTPRSEAGTNPGGTAPFQRIRGD